jgi:hypothetical protein
MSYSQKALVSERDELRQDLIAWTRAYDILRQRVRESSEVPRNPPLYQWSGSRAVLGSLELSIHAIERTIEEYNGLLSQIADGSIPNTDLPGLALVKDDNE